MKYKNKIWIVISLLKLKNEVANGLHMYYSSKIVWKNKIWTYHIQVKKINLWSLSLG